LIAVKKRRRQQQCSMFNAQRSTFNVQSGKLTASPTAAPLLSA
jgi:hypothetical protein